MKSMKRILGAIAAFVLACSLPANAVEVIKLQVDKPLRDPCITRGPDNFYYLTGTTGTPMADGSIDFDVNDGVPVWRSKNLENWEALGYGWTFERDARKDLDKKAFGVFYLSALMPIPVGEFGAKNVRGITAPKLFFRGERPCLAISVNGHNTVLIRHPSGKEYDAKATGIVDRLSVAMPRRMTEIGRDPSVFSDDHGALYWIWNEGWIARMKDDLTGLAEPPRSLMTRLEGFPDTTVIPCQSGERGAFIFKSNGRYNFLFTADGVDGDRPVTCLIVAAAKELFGPYSQPRVLARDIGPATIERGPDGTPFAVATPNAQTEPVLIPLRETADGLQPAIVPPSLRQPREQKEKFPESAILKDGPIVATERAEANGFRYDRASKHIEPARVCGPDTLAPLFDTPLRRTSICRGHDGAWYLTGESAIRGEKGREDFENNDGIRVWRSDDQKQWTCLGRIWSFEKDSSASDKSAWHRYRRPVRGEQNFRLAHGFSDPNIHFINGRYWIAYSLNGHGSGLLRSRGDNPAGPYEDLGRITAAGGGSPSLFQDDDGKVYWLWGHGYIREMKDDLTGLTGETRLLPALISPWMSHHTGNYMDYTWYATENAGPIVFKHENRYHFCFAVRSCRFQSNTYDTYSATAASLTGPFSFSEPMLPHGGHATVFPGRDGDLYASFYGADWRGAFMNRPSVLKLKQKQIGEEGGTFKFFTMPDGVCAELGYDKRFFKVFLDSLGTLRDPFVLLGPDGHYYVTSSTDWSPEEIRILRGSPDFQTWECIGPVYTKKEFENDPNIPNRDPAAPPPKINEWAQFLFWDVKMYHFRDTYWILCSTYSPSKVKMSGAMLLRSESGKAEGPYKVQYYQNDGGMATMMAKDDTMYFNNLTCYTSLMKRDMTGLGEKILDLDPNYGLRIAQDGFGCPTPYKGGMILSCCNCAPRAGYDGRYYISEDKVVAESYTMARTALPWMGSSNIFQDKGGRWWAVIMPGWGSCMIPCAMTGIYPVTIEKVGGDYLVEPDAIRERRLELERLGYTILAPSALRVVARNTLWKAGAANRSSKE